MPNKAVLLGIKNQFVCSLEVYIDIGIVISRIYLRYYSLGQYVLSKNTRMHTYMTRSVHKQRIWFGNVSRLGGRFIKLVLVQICPVLFLVMNTARHAHTHEHFIESKNFYHVLLRSLFFLLFFLSLVLSSLQLFLN